MTTKNVTVDGVEIEASRLPRELRPLLVYANEWCFLDDHAVYDDLESKPESAIREFVTACKLKLHALEDYCLGTPVEMPLPDEAVLVKTLYQNFLAARSYLWMVEGIRRQKGGAITAFHHD